MSSVNEDVVLKLKQLFDAVRSNNMLKAMAAIESPDVDVNWVNDEENGKTVLHLAAEKQDGIFAALLLGKGAEVHIRDKDGRTPLNVALDNKNMECVQLLANKAVSSLEEAKKQLKLSPRKSATVTHLSFSPARIEYTSIEKQQQEDRQFTASLNTIPSLRFESPVNQSPFEKHVPRESAMSELLKIVHFKTIYNIFVAVLLIAFMNIAMLNYFEMGVILDFSLFWWCFGDFPFAVGVWTGMFLYSFFVVPLQKLLVIADEHYYARLKDATKASEAQELDAQRNRYKKLVYGLYLILHVIYYALASVIVFQRHFPPSTGFFVMCECVRLSMKIHSFMMVNRDLAAARHQVITNAAGPGPLANDPLLKQYPKNVTFGNYFYFLWAPTLIYQPSYPRTERVNWMSFLKHLLESFGAVLYTYAIFVRYCVPLLSEMQGSYLQLIFSTFQVMLPATVVSLLAFYGILHCWLNAFAELTRFADKQFYSDWWNASNWATYYRKWNVVVHKFLHCHLFIEMRNLGFSKNTAMVMTFVLSAIWHEYIIALALGFYRPILLIMFAGPGVLFIPLTGMVKGGRASNIFMWAMLFVGNGMLVTLYSRAFHFYYDQLAKEGFNWGSFFGVW